MAETLLYPLWAIPLPCRQKSWAKEKLLVAAVLIWATSKCLMDESIIAEERGRVCQEFGATGRERGDNCMWLSPGTRMKTVETTPKTTPGRHNMASVFKQKENEETEAQGQ